MDVSVCQVDSFNGSELDDAVNVCIRAFGEDLSVQAMIWGNNDLKDSLFRSMIRAAGHAGNIFVARLDGTDEIVGISLWFAPGTVLFADEEQRNLGYYEFRNRLVPAGSEWWDKTYLPPTHELADKSLGMHEAALNTWFLFNVAVDPEHQGKGIARKLIEIVLPKANEDKVPLGLCCTSDVNASIYQSMGFNIKGKMTMEGYGGSVFPVYCLSRNT